MPASAGDARIERFICDAMCGGLARWLRALGHDTSYTPDIDDAVLVSEALRESRLILSGDTRMFERRLIVQGQVRGLLIPHGLRLQRQLEFVLKNLRLSVNFPRCMRCNGELERVDRAAVADRVPARSLLWATQFFECRACRSVFWNGTHWQRIDKVRDLARQWAAATQ